MSKFSDFDQNILSLSTEYTLDEKTQDSIGTIFLISNKAKNRKVQCNIYDSLHSDLEKVSITVFEGDFKLNQSEPGCMIDYHFFRHLDLALQWINCYLMGIENTLSLPSSKEKAAQKMIDSIRAGDAAGLSRALRWFQLLDPNY